MACSDDATKRCLSDTDCTGTATCAVNVWGSGGHAAAQRYGVVGGKVPLTLPTDLETADDYRILVHEESTGLTCRSDYFTIANAGEVPTPQPFYACCRAEIKQSLPVA